MDAEQLRELIDSKTAQLQQDAEDFRNSMLKLLEEAKTNEILTAINGLSKRISSLENRIPLEDPD